MQTPSWIKSNKNDFDLLTEHVYNNLNNEKFKTTVEGKPYSLRKAKKFLVKMTAQKISEQEALELYSDLIIPNIKALKKSKGKAF